jgi:hypothetical protein
VKAEAGTAKAMAEAATAATRSLRREIMGETLMAIPA